MLVEEMIKITTAVGGFTFPNGATATQQDGTADKNPSDNTHNTAPPHRLNPAKTTGEQATSIVLDSLSESQRAHGFHG
jgi:hypothetical protein